MQHDLLRPRVWRNEPFSEYIYLLFSFLHVQCGAHRAPPTPRAAPPRLSSTGAGHGRCCFCCCCCCKASRPPTSPAPAVSPALSTVASANDPPPKSCVPRSRLRAPSRAPPARRSATAPRPSLHSAAVPARLRRDAHLQRLRHRLRHPRHRRMVRLHQVVRHRLAEAQPRPDRAHAWRQGLHDTGTRTCNDHSCPINCAYLRASVSGPRAAPRAPPARSAAAAPSCPAAPLPNPNSPKPLDTEGAAAVISGEFSTPFRVFARPDLSTWKWKESLVWRSSPPPPKARRAQF